MKRPTFTNGYIYHIYNRGVEKRKVFIDDRDFLRFVVALYEFNDSHPIFNVGRNFFQQPIEVRLQSKRKNQLVEILAFCLMPNHYHIVMRQKAENGITEFMRKIGTGYTNYFNLKYSRVGHLFQGKFKAVLLEQEAHFIHLPHYVHLNPLDLFQPAWRERGVENVAAALDFLKTYRWSSFLDYIGSSNFPSVTEREFLQICVGGAEDFYGASRDWLEATAFDFIQDVVLD